MEAKELSKQKYIYELYEDCVGNLHCEKHRVIYANSKYVYFKKARKDELDWVLVRYVGDTLRDLDCCCTQHCWNFDEKVFAQLKATKRHDKLDKEIKRLTLRMSELARHFENTSKYYNELVEELKKLEEKENE